MSAIHTAINNTPAAPAVVAPIVDAPLAPIVAELAAPAVTAVALVEPEAIEEPAIVDERGPIRWAWDAICLIAEWLFGLFSLVLGLSLLASYPLFQMLSLGYLLESSGRVAHSGRLRDGFVGVRKAAHVGSLFFGAWLVLWPLRFASSMASSARLIEPDSPADRFWSATLVVLTVSVVAHIMGACWRGGKLRHFLWPRPVKLARQVLRPGSYAEARDAVWEFVAGLRLPYYFWLGLRGFAGGLVWLFLPVSMLALGQKAPAVGFLGALAFIVVLLYLPFVQTRFAAENRFGAMFAIGGVRRAFRRAPVAFLLALFVTLLFALPLYLLKIEIIPREAAWLPSLVFVAFIFPARLFTGWAYGYATHRDRNRNWFLRQASRLAMLPVAAFYVLIVFFTQYTSWHGIASLYEQHAFLVPVPFLGL